MSVAEDIRLYPLLFPHVLTNRLEDVQYRFALADTDEKLARTLKVCHHVLMELTEDLPRPHAPQAQYNFATRHPQGLSRMLLGTPS
jgi:hypothetical protein